MPSYLDYFWSLFSGDLGVDLGTANTVVLVRGRGIVLREPSVVAIHKKSGAVLAVGVEAKMMIGKTPASILAVRPLREGVISDFESAQKMLHYFIGKANQTPSRFPKISRPRVVIGIPSGVTQVERKAVTDAAKSAGAREVFLVEEPLAAAIGAGLPISEPRGSMIVDIGGGTTEIAIVSLSGIVVGKSVRVAGDSMDQNIIEYAKKHFNLLLGERSAEEAKIAAGSAYPFDDPAKEAGEAPLRGRDLGSGLPKEIAVTSPELREAVWPSVSQISRVIKDAIEETPPELLSDVMKDGITLAGGASQLSGLDKHLSQECEVPVRVAQDPMSCVVKGAGMLLEDLELLRRVSVS